MEFENSVCVLKCFTFSWRKWVLKGSCQQLQSFLGGQSVFLAIVRNGISDNKYWMWPLAGSLKIHQPHPTPMLCDSWTSHEPLNTSTCLHFLTRRSDGNVPALSAATTSLSLNTFQNVFTYLLSVNVCMISISGGQNGLKFMYSNPIR